MFYVSLIIVTIPNSLEKNKSFVCFNGETLLYDEVVSQNICNFMSNRTVRVWWLESVLS